VAKCGDRLSNFRIILLDDNDNELDSFYVNTVDKKHIQSIPYIAASKVRIQIEGYGILSLAEVKIYGKE